MWKQVTKYKKLITISYLNKLKRDKIQEQQTYWWPSPFRSVAKAGLSIKVVDSDSGPGPALRNALWHGKDTPGQVQVLWEDEGAQGWEDFTAYRWLLQHRPEVGFIQVQIFNGEKEIVNSG